MSDERFLSIEVEYQKNQVPQDVDEAIHTIMRNAARLITAKLALLSNPRIVSVKATTFVNAKFEDLLADESSSDQP